MNVGQEREGQEAADCASVDIYRQIEEEMRWRLGGQFAALPVNGPSIEADGAKARCQATAT